MNPFKLIGKTIYILLIVVLISASVITALTVLPGPKGYRFFIVQSGSMEPSLKTGSLVFVAPQNNYSVSDPISFLANPTQKDLKKPGATVTHRIVELQGEPGKQIYTTKGDANEDADREKVHQADVLGKVLFSIPYYGRIISFTRTQTGFFLVIALPISLLIYSEILTIKSEIIKLFKKAKKSSVPKSQKEEKTEDDSKQA